MISSVLRDKILEFAQNRITISDLEEWLVPQIPTLISDPNSVESDLVSAIELGIAELDAGIRTQDDLIQFFQQVLRENPVISLNLSATSTGTSSNTSQVGVYHSDLQDVINASWVVVH